VLTIDQTTDAAHVADPMRPTPHRIHRLRRETNDTFTLEIAPAEGESRLSFAPGQFNMLYVYGVGEVPISISGKPSGRKLIEHTTREVGTVTKAMRKLKRGDMIGLRGPFGTHWPVKERTGCDYVIVAGGIGLAPLRPALYHLMAHRKQYRRLVLLYGTRTPEDILYRHELEHWRSKFDMEVYVTVDRASEGWLGNVGVVTTMIGRAPFDPLNTVALVCGPEVMMRYTVMELHKRGVDPANTYVSMERNMKCAIGFCGHCQYGPEFICRDGPVFCFDRIAPIFGRTEV
jgi:NAD(P)H-flavin reductase